MIVSHLAIRWEGDEDFKEEERETEKGEREEKQTDGAHIHAFSSTMHIICL